VHTDKTKTRTFLFIGKKILEQKALNPQRKVVLRSKSKKDYQWQRK